MFQIRSQLHIANLIYAFFLTLLLFFQTSYAVPQCNGSLLKDQKGKISEKKYFSTEYSEFRKLLNSSSGRIFLVTHVQSNEMVFRHRFEILDQLALKQKRLSPEIDLNLSQLVKSYISLANQTNSTLQSEAILRDFLLSHKLHWTEIRNRFEFLVMFNILMLEKNETTQPLTTQKEWLQSWLEAFWASDIEGASLIRLSKIMEASYEDFNSLDVPTPFQIRITDQDANAQFDLMVRYLNLNLNLKSIQTEVWNLLQNSEKENNKVLLKRLRKSLMLARYIFYALSSKHIPPDDLDRLVKIIGKHLDADKAGRKDLVKKTRIEMKQLLNQIDIPRTIGTFKAASSKSIQSHLNDLQRNIHRILSYHQPVSLEKFHFVRKAVRQLQAVLRLQYAISNSPEILNIISRLHKLNEETGLIHDEYVKADYIGQVNYDKTKTQFPEELAFDLDRTLDLIHFY
jgi:hypothetical protein